MKSTYFILSLTVVFFGSCSSWRNVMVAEGNEDDAVQNAIHDFLYFGEETKKNNVFYVYVKNINQKVLGVNIFGTNDKVLVSTEDSITFSYGGFPTRYFEKNGKLFYWHDSTKVVTNDLISTLTRYNLIDTMIVDVYIPEHTVDHSKKGVDYYFCKDNLLKYKKVRTKRAMGWYNPPKLRCSH